MDPMFLNPNANARPFRGAAAIAPYNADGGHSGWGRKKPARRSNATALPSILAPAGRSNSGQTQSTTPTVAEQEHARTTSIRRSDNQETIQDSSVPPIIDVNYPHQSQSTTNEQHDSSSYSQQPQPALPNDQSDASRNSIYKSPTSSSRDWNSEMSVNDNLHDQFHELLSNPLASSSVSGSSRSQLSELPLPVFDSTNMNSRKDDRAEAKSGLESLIWSSSPSEQSTEDCVKDEDLFPTQDSYMFGHADLILASSESASAYPKISSTDYSDSYPRRYAFSYAENETTGHYSETQHETSYTLNPGQIWPASDRKADTVDNISSKSNLQFLSPWSDQHEMGNNRLAELHLNSVDTPPEQRSDGASPVNYLHLPWPSSASNNSRSDMTIDGPAEDYQPRGGAYGRVQHDVKLPRTTLSKEVVGTPAIRQAGASRRKTLATFTCQYRNCDAAFTRKHNLKNHIETHQGTAVTHCEKCGKELARSSLRRHEKKCIYPVLVSQIQ